jgi:ppGpp synthetase/RelA/SpoT-type nucleotidyltranferase
VPFQQDTRIDVPHDIITGLAEDWPFSDEMNPPAINWSNKQINEAGKFLARSDQSSDDPDTVKMSLIVSQWRSVHEYPLQRVMSILRRQVNSRGWMTATVSGRTKRLRSIVAKLVRTPSMMLSTMQDLGGCRVILDTIEQVESLAADVRSRLVNQLSRGGEIREYNYISKPKSDGYRSIHFVVRYQSTSKEHDVLRTEIQIRTLLQHRWATAVETVDLFTGQTLKTGGGDARWKRFFMLTGSLFALKENRETVSGTPGVAELKSEASALAKELQVLDKLQGWSNVMRSMLEVHGLSLVHYFLVELDIDSKTTRIWSFSGSHTEEAHLNYRFLEQANANLPNRSTVLVSANSLAEVKQGYPGYYGDTQAFLTELEGALEVSHPRVQWSR